jgi:UDP-N-acetylmuramate: L-alanyl-gamma-D-glutamyl-meso-diaminopimelate ligase
MSWVAMELGIEPGFLIGGIAKNFSRSFQNPKGNYFVIEGDEYDTAYFDKVPKFVHYKPKHVILTSVEFDHADIYADLNAVKFAFAKLLSLIPQDGTLVYCAEDQNVCELVQASKFLGIKASYGIRKGDIQAEILSVTEKGTTFKAKRGPETIGEFQTIMTGDYNIQNALGVITLCLLKNFDMKKVQSAFKTFQGVKRRQEILGEPNGVLVIEDFAHHPTAVRETVKGIKSKYNGRKIFAVFEPRSATSRRKIFQQDYANAFKDADEVLIMKAFDQGKIDEANRFSSDELVADIKTAGKKAHAFDSVEQIVSELKGQSRRGDLILIMSNGGFDGIYDKLMKALSV